MTDPRDDRIYANEERQTVTAIASVVIAAMVFYVVFSIVFNGRIF